MPTIDVVRVARRDDPRFERDRVADEVVGIPRAVGTFMVCPKDGGNGLQARDGAQESVTDDRVALNLGVFGVGEPPGLGEYPVLDAELADVVQQGAEYEVP